MTDVYIYVRYSTPKQEFTLSGAKSSSEERQLEACKAFAKQHGWNVVDVIKDLGKSAWKGDHLTKGNLGKFVARIHAGDIPRDSVILAENIDRFSRQEARVTQRWIEDICDAGMQIATVSGNKVYNAQNLSENLMSILEILFLAEGAYRYVQNLVSRVKGSYESRLREARIDKTAIHSVGPAWLKAVGKRPDIKWEQIPDRVKLVREIYDMAAGGKPPWTIAKELNGRPDCLSFGGKAWERTSIVKILRSKAVEGDYVVGVGKASKPTGEVMFGYYGEPIVSLDVIKQARAMLDRRRRGSGRNSGAVNSLFGQKIRCGHCRGRMMLAGYQSRYLTCYEANRGNGCTHTTTYKYRKFEAAALSAILHLTLDERFFREAKKSNHLGLDIARVEKDIRDKQGEAERLVSLLARVESPTTEAKLVTVEGEIVALNGELTKLNEELTKADGAASAEAHLERVHGIREALSHPQDEIRLPARLRVSEALQSMVDGVECGTNGWGDKRTVLYLAGGVHRVAFDNEGETLWEVLPNTGATADEMLEGMDEAANRQRMEAYFKRRA